MSRAADHGAVTLWEFRLCCPDGAATDQIVIAVGADEAAAAGAAAMALALSDGVALMRPGERVSARARARWLSLRARDSFPLVVSLRGRTALFARGP
jgi:hypothetical protein